MTDFGVTNPVNYEMLYFTEIQCFAYQETPSCEQCMNNFLLRFVTEATRS